MEESCYANFENRSKNQRKETGARSHTGKVIDDDKQNKHYVCKEKVWEYHTSDSKYLLKMLEEQTAMGFIEEEDDM